MVTFSQGAAAKIKSRQFSELRSRTIMVKTAENLDRFLFAIFWRTKTAEAVLTRGYFKGQLRGAWDKPGRLPGTKHLSSNGSFCISTEKF